MANNPNNIEVGKIVRLFHAKGCIGIRVENEGIKKGDTLLLETTRDRRFNLTVTANSIEIDHEAVNKVSPGSTCAIAIPQDPNDTERFPHNGMRVFKVVKEKGHKGAYFT